MLVLIPRYLQTANSSDNLTCQKLLPLFIDLQIISGSLCLALHSHQKCGREYTLHPSISYPHNTLHEFMPSILSMRDLTYLPYLLIVTVYWQNGGSVIFFSVYRTFYFFTFAKIARQKSCITQPFPTPFLT